MIYIATNREVAGGKRVSWVVGGCEKLHGAHERDTIEVPVTIDPVGDKKDVRPRLVVVEIRSVMIGHDAQGEQTPQTATWSLGIPEKK